MEGGGDRETFECQLTETQTRTHTHPRTHTQTVWQISLLNTLYLLAVSLTNTMTLLFSPLSVLITFSTCTHTHAQPDSVIQQGKGAAINILVYSQKPAEICW